MNDIISKLLAQSDPPWSYAEYINTALYHADAGYYMKEKTKLGKEGDFYTSNHVHPVFARTFARFFADVFKKEEFTPAILEAGGGDGRFASNVLSYFKDEEPELYEEIVYIIADASPYHRSTLNNLAEAYGGKVQIVSSAAFARKLMPGFSGIIFSNELIDALPVHSVVQGKGELLEAVVLPGEEALLKEELRVCENEQVINWINDYGPVLPEGFRTEVNLEMKELLKEFASWQKSGLLVTVDYGYTNEQLTLPERKEGSLRGYYKHQMVNSPLEMPGEMDITSHVQWDAFIKIGEDAGYSLIYHDNQDKFLLNGGLFKFLQEVRDPNPFSDSFRQNRAIQSLVQPGGISSAFQVNILGRDAARADEYKIFTEDPYSL
ncbi:SAM-dependent methyltransferase [Evansella sp. LMS18]|uniref:SAM-dependent methyltransferase n=1 Tax=Evansella sp. LMS18 TaxID=2924033 RepID=UPI0020D04AEC|nr:SAM-dependent methyltransferase [Evansella sp. LMS18]UTR09424.1 SAM-dependent methyltransferase [Evansella sp. LMS18]